MLQLFNIYAIDSYKVPRFKLQVSTTPLGVSHFTSGPVGDFRLVDDKSAKVLRVTSPGRPYPVHTRVS